MPAEAATKMATNSDTAGAEPCGVWPAWDDADLAYLELSG
jgi:hypothetical protein